jgi:hypothetical protein
VDVVQVIVGYEYAPEPVIVRLDEPQKLFIHATGIDDQRVLHAIFAWFLRTKNVAV